jgi:Pentapeptide repeats (9 copies)
MGEGDKAAADEFVAECQANEHVKAFFLDLAAQGKDAWNAWRHDKANANVRVTFEGVDFGEADYSGINFAGFDFGDEADFSGCTWQVPEHVIILDANDALAPGRAIFAGATFGDQATFTDATFGDYATFVDSVFGQSATFTGTTFGELAEFSGVKFGPYANFGRAKFGRAASISSATFAHEVTFLSATFGYRSRFNGAKFGGRVTFTGASFGEQTTFTKAEFGDLVDFSDSTFERRTGFNAAIFGEQARFNGATFGRSIQFTGAIFSASADFTRSAFADEATFEDVLFKGRASFSGESIDERTDGLAVPAREIAGAKRQKPLEDQRSSNDRGPDRFLRISFADARFRGEAIFSHRSFDRPANFAEAKFHHPPDFDNATNVGRIDFSGATIQFVPPEWPWWKPHWVKKTDVALRLRAFRKIAEETKNHDLERDLYIEERKAERGPTWMRLRSQVEKRFTRFAEACLIVSTPSRDRPCSLGAIAETRAYAELGEPGHGTLSSLPVDWRVTARGSSSWRSTAHSPIMAAASFGRSRPSLRARFSSAGATRPFLRRSTKASWRATWANIMTL